jgi:hypothetical protein
MCCALHDVYNHVGDVAKLVGHEQTLLDISAIY